MSSEHRLAKHREVYCRLKKSILEGEYGLGDRIPTESELQKHFNISRITVSRALQDLARDGFLVRRRGAGSFVARVQSPVQELFGMLAPDLSGIFSPLCKTITRELEAAGHHLTISTFYSDKPEQVLQFAEEACRRWVAGGVRGLFLSPLELPPQHMWVNEEIARMVVDRGLALVLLDRDVCKGSPRSQYDLVGCADAQAVQVLVHHLLALGRRRLVLITGSLAASTTMARISGFREVLAQAGMPVTDDSVRCCAYGSSQELSQLVASCDADGYVCINDHMAVNVTRALLDRGVKVPEDVSVVGIDDVEYAAMVPVPLTTMRQPLEHIGRAAVKLLFERMADPTIPARHLSFACELIVRESCGAKRGSWRPQTAQ